MTHVSVRPSRTLTDGWDIQFQDVGGESALRRATRSNPRDRPCPTCGKSDRLTQQDVACGYQCNDCADRAEGAW